MPNLSLEEALEITKIHSVAGTLLKKMALSPLGLFALPHHSISDVALIGGQHTQARRNKPVSLRGLILDDYEFNRKALEALRQPLEENRYLYPAA